MIEFETNTTEKLELPTYLSGDIIDYSSTHPNKPLVIVVEDEGEKLTIAKLKKVEDGKYKALGVGGGFEKPVDRESVLVTHLDREEMLDTLARYAGVDGSPAFITYREVIAGPLDETLGREQAKLLH